jgi:hypothetical protein
MRAILIQLALRLKLGYPVADLVNQTPSLRLGVPRKETRDHASA